MAIVRHCGRCQTDQDPHIAVCAACGGPLEDRCADDLAGGRRGGPEPVPAGAPLTGDATGLHCSGCGASARPADDRCPDCGAPMEA